MDARGVLGLAKCQLHGISTFCHFLYRKILKLAFQKGVPPFQNTLFFQPPNFHFGSISARKDVQRLSIGRKCSAQRVEQNHNQIQTHRQQLDIEHGMVWTRKHEKKGLIFKILYGTFFHFSSTSRAQIDLKPLTMNLRDKIDPF